MAETDRAIRNISDTALWAAMFRARETERGNALFRDPFAQRLAGDRGEAIFRHVPNADRDAWAWVVRTYLYDHFITTQVAEGVDTIINLAAGLDARPYRMALPSSLRWIEIDLPDLLAYKESVLRNEGPVCALSRIALDLSDISARRELFARLGGEARRALIVTEGLLIYLSPNEVGALARDLAAPPSFQRWVIDIASPGLLRMMRKRVGDRLSLAGAAFKFGPEEGPGFFTPHGWRPIDVRSMLKTAARLGRLPRLLRLVALLPESQGAQGSRPWSATCLMERRASSPSVYGAPGALCRTGSRGTRPRR